MKSSDSKNWQWLNELYDTENIAYKSEITDVASWRKYKGIKNPEVIEKFNSWKENETNPRFENMPEELRKAFDAECAIKTCDLEEVECSETASEKLKRIWCLHPVLKNTGAQLTPCQAKAVKWFFVQNGEMQAAKELDEEKYVQLCSVIIGCLFAISIKPHDKKLNKFINITFKDGEKYINEFIERLKNERPAVNEKHKNHIYGMLSQIGTKMNWDIKSPNKVIRVKIGGNK